MAALDLESLLSQGLEHLENNEISRAITKFSEAVRCDGTQARPFFLRGRAYLRQNDLTRAMEDFTRVTSLDSVHFMAFYFRGLVLLRLKQPEQAMQDFNQVAALKPNLALGWLGIGMARARIPALQQHAAVALSRSLEYSSSNRSKSASLVPERLLRRAQACRYLALLPGTDLPKETTRQSLLEQAHEILNTAVEANTSVELIAERALVRCALGLEIQSKQDFDLATEVDPYRTLPYPLCAQCGCLLMWNPSRVERQPLLEELEAMRGILPATDEFRQHITHMIEFVEHKDRGLAALFAKRGFNFLRLGKLEEAVQDFALGSRLDSACGTAQLGLGIAELNNPASRSQGFQTLRAALKKLTDPLSPNDTTLLLRRAQALRLYALPKPSFRHYLCWKSKIGVLAQAHADTELLMSNPHCRIAAMVERGLVRVAQDNLGLAREDFDAVLSQDRASTCGCSFFFNAAPLIQVIITERHEIIHELKLMVEILDASDPSIDKINSLVDCLSCEATEQQGTAGRSMTPKVVVGVH